MVIFGQSLSTNKKLVEKVRLCYKRAQTRYSACCLVLRLHSRNLRAFLRKQERGCERRVSHLCLRYLQVQATGKHLDVPKQSEQKLL